ncbi:MAG: nicotinamidase-related amidase [Pseudohongiellaceae bacterium]|jgi:nicotinamidase-related amidase
MKTSLITAALLAACSLLVLSEPGFPSAKVEAPAASASPAAAASASPASPANLERVALVVTDPQNDFLSTAGVAWQLVGASVTENGTVEHIEQLFAAAQTRGIPTFVSPHYYYPHDHSWKFEGTLEGVMHKIGMFDRTSPLSVDSFEGSGADWLEQYKPYIDDAVVTSPHKIYGPETNDLVLQLRKRGIDTVVLAGMSANLCTESHMRELLEQGFEVIVVSDATAAARTDMGDGYQAAMINFRYMANDVVDTAEALRFFAGEDS